MKFYADENIPRPFVRRLRQDGHGVEYVIEQGRGRAEHTILQAALLQETLVLTLDKDYRRMVLEEKKPTLGVIWVRLSGMTLAERTEYVAQVIQAQGNQLLYHFTIIYPDRVEMLPLDTGPTAP